MTPNPLIRQLEELYRKYNRKCYVHPDPLEFLYRYEDVRDREVVGFVAAALAYGNVTQILKSVEAALGRMGASPREYLDGSCPADFFHDFDGFVHRFATGRHMAAMLTGIKGMLATHGSLMEGFAAGCRETDATYLSALNRFAGAIRALSGESDPGHLIAMPDKGSACKRLNLFLRWMIRGDDVDPGGWEPLSPSKLVIPLDTHMFRICGSLGFTCRKQANAKAALEVTAAFSRLIPEDPVRYDFVLTRQGIRRDEAFGLGNAC